MLEKLGIMKIRPSVETESSLLSIGFECLDRDVIKAEKCYAPLAETGVKRARVQTGWVKCETEKGKYDFAWLDDIVDNLLQIGVKPWFNVGYGNPIYMENISKPSAVGCVPILYGEEVEKAYIDFLLALAEHYRGRVDDFEIWNEPDLKQFWYPEEPNGKKYAYLVKISGAAIRSVLPNCRIGAGIATRHWDFLESLLNELTPGDIDFLATHTYSLRPENNHYIYMENFRRILKKYRHEKVSLWQGEGGYPSWFHEGHSMNKGKPSSEHQQAVWMARRFLLDAQAGLETSSYFQIADMWERPYDMATLTRPKPAAQGILNGLTYTPKLSQKVLGRIANLFSGGVKPLDAFCVGDFEGDGNDMRFHLTFSLQRKDGQPIFAYCIPYFLQEERPLREGFWLDIGKDPSYVRDEPLVLLDPLTGEVFRVTPETNTDAFYHFDGLPFGDYPMILCYESAITIE